MGGCEPIRGWEFKREDKFIRGRLIKRVVMSRGVGEDVMHVSDKHKFLDFTASQSDYNKRPNLTLHVITIDLQ